MTLNDAFDTSRHSDQNHFKIPKADVGRPNLLSDPAHCAPAVAVAVAVAVALKHSRPVRRGKSRLGSAFPLSLRSIFNEVAGGSASSPRAVCQEADPSITSTSIRSKIDSFRIEIEVTTNTTPLTKKYFEWPARREKRLTTTRKT